MKEHPIIFSGDMVRSILDGRKTQTRRVIKPQPVIKTEDGDCGSIVSSWLDWDNPQYRKVVDAGHRTVMDAFCPYGLPGDHLWVREAWARRRGIDGPTPKSLHYLKYRADGVDLEMQFHPYTTWIPSIHMPRWASRLTLGIVRVRVERLKDLTMGDARAEGFMGVGEFADYWDDLNGKRGLGWEANQWVWVIEFKKV